MAEFLQPLAKYGIKKLEISQERKISRFYLITKPRKLEDLIQGELELRTEIYLALGSELLTYGLEKFIMFMKDLRGEETPPEFSSTLKYNVIRIEPEFTEEEENLAQELYYNKINKPVAQFVNALGDRVKKGKELLEDTDKFARKEGTKVAQDEIIRRLRKTSKDFGFDLSKITKSTTRILDRILNVVGEKEIEFVPEYRALIKPQSKREVNPQLVIHQTGHHLRIMGGSQLTSEQEIDDIDPELLNDALKYILLTKEKK